MKMDDYIKIVIPIIELCREERTVNKKGYKRTQLWYLYRQAFYGFGDFINWKTRCKSSAKAQIEYQKKFPNKDIRMRNWREQNKFDTGRQKGLYHLEHIYTGDMFRKAIDNLKTDELTVYNINKIISDNYYVAWILKSENARLKRTDRGETIKEALKFYEDMKIHLLK